MAGLIVNGNPVAGALGLWYSYPSYKEYGVDVQTEVRQLNQYIAESDMEGVTAIATDSLPTRYLGNTVHYSQRQIFD